jgi:hypothetical protein
MVAQHYITLYTIFNITELYLKMVKVVNYMLCAF